MLKGKLRFTVLDFLVIFIIVFILVYSLIRGINLSNFNNRVFEKDVIVTLKITGLPQSDFEHFYEGGTIYRNEASSKYRVGIVSKIRSNPSVKQILNESSIDYSIDYSAIDVYIDVSASAVIDIHNFTNVDGLYYIPADTFNGDNGRIKFDCEIVSVKYSD